MDHTERGTHATVDRRSRVTVVGATKRVDIALPSDTPIGEYVVGLADLCAQEQGGLLPPAWSLASAGREPFPVAASLAEAGVVDGQVLYLRNVARDPNATPVVEDVGEVVAEETSRLRERGLSRGVPILCLGLLWLAGTAVLAASRHGPGTTSVAAILIVTALLTLGAAWVLQQRQAGIPPVLSRAVAMVSLPCLGGAGALLGQSFGGRGLFWVGAIAGANLATLMVLAVMPEPVLFTLLLPLAATGLLAVLLAALHADSTQAAAAATVAALAFVAAAKPLAGTVAAWSTRLPRDGRSVEAATIRLLLRARYLLAASLTAPALVLAGTLPVLAISRQPYGIALAGVASLALLLRARQVGFTVEAVLLGCAGGVGIFATVAELVYRYFDNGLAALALAAAGACVAAAGAAFALLRRPEPVGEDEPVLGGHIPPPDRMRSVDVIGMLCMLAVAPLAMGVFGVFAELVSMGRAIIG